MSPNIRNSRVKGFTLTEMIVVIAIIGILVGILTPSMINYYRSSRIKASNSDAKMVYNAAQTEIMRYMNIDRAARVDISDPLKFKSGFSGTMVLTYDPNGTVSSSASINNTPTAVSASDTSARAEACRTVVRNVNTTVSGANMVSWAVCVHNYIVEASVSAQNGTSNYVGFYSANKQSAELEDISGSYSTVYLSRLGTLSAQYGTNQNSNGGNSSGGGSAATGTTESAT